MNLFGVFTTKGSTLVALFRNRLDAEHFVSQVTSTIPLTVEKVNASDAIKMWG